MIAYIKLPRAIARLITAVIYIPANDANAIQYTLYCNSLSRARYPIMLTNRKIVRVVLNYKTLSTA